MLYTTTHFSYSLTVCVAGLAIVSARFNTLHSRVASVDANRCEPLSLSSVVLLALGAALSVPWRMVHRATSFTRILFLRQCQSREPTLQLRSRVHINHSSARNGLIAFFSVCCCDSCSLSFRSPSTPSPNIHNRLHSVSNVHVHASTHLTSIAQSQASAFLPIT